MALAKTIRIKAPKMPVVTDALTHAYLYRR